MNLGRTQHSDYITFHSRPSKIHVLLICRLHSFHPNNPRNLVPAATQKSKSKISSRYHLNQNMGETFILRQIVLQLWTVKSNTLGASKIQWRDGHEIDIPIPKGETGKEKGVIVSEQVQNLKAYLWTHWGGRWAPKALGGLTPTALLDAAHGAALTGWSPMPVFSGTVVSGAALCRQPHWSLT